MKMMRFLWAAFITLGVLNCSTDKTGNQYAETELAQTEEMNNVFNSEGYQLMEQKCFICHFAKPDPSKKDAMIAPPMLRVQEHYKPSYSSRNEFIDAVVKWINDPSEEETLMPGAVRKFNLMPKLPYDETELKLIAGALFDTNFGHIPTKNGHKSQSNRTLTLNRGEKWQLIPAHIAKVQSIITQLNSFEADDVSTYNELGRNVFDNAKVLLLETSYSEELFEELHVFFHGIEGDMHLLIAAQSIADAKKQQEALKIKFNVFQDFFE